MAKAHSPHLLRGKIGNLIYRVRDGRQLVHLAPAPWQERTRYQRRLRRPIFRLQVELFGGASTIACDLYGELFFGLKALVRPYTHNRLTALLRNAGEYNDICVAHPSGQVHAGAYRVYDVWKALQGRDLSHEGAPTARVSMTPTGPQHNPTAVRIAGLRDAARAVPVHGNARLELRIHIRQANLQEMAYDPEGRQWRPLDPSFTPARHRGVSGSRPSGWIPADILPKGDLDLPLPESPDGDKFVSAVVIEWREVRAVDGKEVLHPRHAIARIAAVHGTAEDFTQATHNRKNPNHNPADDQDPDAFTTKTDWRLNPREYFEEALFHIKT